MGDSAEEYSLVLALGRLALVGLLGDSLVHLLGDVLGQSHVLGLGAVVLGALGLELLDVLRSLDVVVGVGDGLVGESNGRERDEDDVLEKHCRSGSVRRGG